MSGTNGNGKNGNGRVAKFKVTTNIAKRKALAELVGNPFDTRTIVEKCKDVGTTDVTYYRWMNTDPEFPAMIIAVSDRYDAAILSKSLQRMQSLIGSENENIATMNIRTALQSVGKIKTGANINVTTTQVVEGQHEFRGGIAEQLQKRMGVLTSEE